MYSYMNMYVYIYMYVSGVLKNNGCMDLSIFFYMDKHIPNEDYSCLAGKKKIRVHGVRSQSMLAWVSASAALPVDALYSAAMDSEWALWTRIFFFGPVMPVLYSACKVPVAVS